MNKQRIRAVIISITMLLSISFAIYLCMASFRSYSDYETLVNRETGRQISVGMSQKEIERELGRPTSEEIESGKDNPYYETKVIKEYDGIRVIYYDDQAVAIIVKEADTDYMTKVGQFEIGDTLDEVKSGLGEESWFNSPFQTTTYVYYEDNGKLKKADLKNNQGSEWPAYLLNSKKYCIEFTAEQSKEIYSLSLIDMDKMFGNPEQINKASA